MTTNKSGPTIWHESIDWSGPKPTREALPVSNDTHTTDMSTVRVRLVKDGQIRGPFELIRVTDDVEAIVRDDGGDVLVFDDLWSFELQCRRCGVFAGHVGPVDDPTCFNSDSDAACGEGTR
jgi:hypothetical protein